MKHFSIVFAQTNNPAVIYVTALITVCRARKAMVDHLLDRIICRVEDESIVEAPDVKPSENENLSRT